MLISEENKLTLLYRVEPGCLGPTGIDYVEGFCESANQNLIPPFYAYYHFVPRYDKSKPEIEYRMKSHKVSDDKVVAYLNVVKSNKEMLEQLVEEEIAAHIDKYLER